MGGGCLYFDAKMIRHAWHYSQPGSGGREGEGRRALDPNVTKSDLMKWKVRNVAPAAPARTGPIRGLQQRASRELRGAGWRMRGQRGPPRSCVHGMGRGGKMAKS